MPANRQFQPSLPGTNWCMAYRSDAVLWSPEPLSIAPGRRGPRGVGGGLWWPRAVEITKNTKNSGSNNLKTSSNNPSLLVRIDLVSLNRDGGHRSARFLPDHADLGDGSPFLHLLCDGRVGDECTQEVQRASAESLCDAGVLTSNASCVCDSSPLSSRVDGRHLQTGVRRRACMRRPMSSTASSAAIRTCLRQSARSSPQPPSAA